MRSALRTRPEVSAGAEGHETTPPGMDARRTRPRDAERAGSGLHVC